MHDGELGDDAARMTALDTKAQAAITALRAITSSDPSAQRAIGAVNALRSMLETGWMPAIRAICSSDALTGGFTTAALGGGAHAWGGRPSGHAAADRRCRRRSPSGGRQAQAS